MASFNNIKILGIILTISLMTVELFSQKLEDSKGIVINIQPVPQRIEAVNKSIILYDRFIPVYAEKSEEKKAANYLKYVVKKYVTEKVSLSVHSEVNELPNLWKIRLKLVENNGNFVNEQYYSIQCSLPKKEIEITSPSQLGLLFGVATFSQFITSENNAIKVNLFNVSDYPAYCRREFSALVSSSEVDDLLDFALMNKIETVAVASRIYPWYKIVGEYKTIFEKIKNWKDRFGGPRIMQMHNVYDRKKIEISNSSDLDSLKIVIEFGIKNGAEKLMILANETPPFQFGKGYILTSGNDKNKFKNMVEANCYLINELHEWLKLQSYKAEFYYYPAFNTYEDLNYGELNLYKNTPWEKDAFEPFRYDLKYIGLNLPEDIYVIWTGPRAESRKITTDDLNDWTNKLQGKIPFLWDNSICSNHPFTSSPIFNTWDNNLPSDFYLKTAGNGMFVNGNLNSEETKAVAVTANDYLWNPTKYNSMNSLNIAMENLYGKPTAELLLQFKEVELSLRKKIGERCLWFEADSLWTIIRKIRFITEKNPWYYQQNYNRLKALRLQLKNSVHEPEAKSTFEEVCLLLDEKRKEVLKKLNEINNGLYLQMEKLMIKLPDFKDIQ